MSINKKHSNFLVHKIYTKVPTKKSGPTYFSSYIKFTLK